MNEIHQVGNIANRINSKRENPQRHRVYMTDGVSPTIHCMTGGGLQPEVIVKDTVKFKNGETCEVGGVFDNVFLNDDGRRHTIEGGRDSPALLANKNDTPLRLESGYRIRKLTPRETWRLMDFTDEDFDKAATVNSPSQLYKQAGNSIVKACLMAIFDNFRTIKPCEKKYEFKQMDMFEEEE